MLYCGRECWKLEPEAVTQTRARVQVFLVFTRMELRHCIIGSSGVTTA
jgi:hypothetical protein